MSGEERYLAGLEELGLADVRPLYRELLKRLREEDAEAYREAVRRYEEELAPAMEEEVTGDAGNPVEPVRDWIRYGAWLAAHVAPGSLTAVDRTGRARPLDELAPDPESDPASGPREPEAQQLGLEASPASPPAEETGSDEGGRVPAGALILHLPDRDREPGITLARPVDPTDFQEAARELLCP